MRSYATSSVRVCGAYHQRQMLEFERLHNEHNIVVLADVWLDKPQVLTQLERLFDGYSSVRRPPFWLRSRTLVHD